MSFLSKGQLFSIFCQLSSFTISEHAEICISCHFCFIICVKACSGTVSNFLTFRIPLNGTIKKKIAPKITKMTMTKTTAITMLSEYIEIIFQNDLFFLLFFK